MNESQTPARESQRLLFAILTGYWVYVTLSNILYAASMNAGFITMNSESYFAPWDARVVQHLVLFPALLASVWASLRIGWRPLATALPMQLVIAAAFALLGSPALTVAQILLKNEEFTHAHKSMGLSDWFDQSNLSLWMASATSMFLAYGFGLALVTGFSLYRRFAAAQLQVSQLEREFSAARLAALRMQLSPHTLFNLLHVIHGQIGWEPKAAQSMIVKLGDLLRRLLRAGERDFAPLADEMQFVRLYLDLQQQRFADRLHIELPARESLPALWVPSLVLQPLVENAVVHGLAGHDGKVTVTVEVSLAGEELHLRVLNTAPAPDSSRGGASGGAPFGVATAASGSLARGEGIGLANVRERLSVQFGGRARCSSGPGEGGVWCAEIVLPQLRDASAGGA